jgi:hypothetical protein
MYQVSAVFLTCMSTVLSMGRYSYNRSYLCIKALLSLWHLVCPNLFLCVVFFCPLYYYYPVLSLPFLILSYKLYVEVRYEQYLRSKLVVQFVVGTNPTLPYLNYITKNPCLLFFIIDWYYVPRLVTSCLITFL